MNKLYAIRSELYPSPRGFTLIEILVAVSIIAIATAVAVPNLRRFNDEQALRNDVSEIVQFLRKAQTNAQSRVTCANSSGDPSKYWEVSIMKNNPAKANQSTYELINQCQSLTGASPDPMPISSWLSVIKNSRVDTITTAAVGCESLSQLSTRFETTNVIKFFSTDPGCSNLTTSKAQIIVRVSGTGLMGIVEIDSGGSIYAIYQ